MLVKTESVLSELEVNYSYDWTIDLSDNTVTMKNFTKNI